MWKKNQVVIEVSSGVAEVTHSPEDIEVIIIDHDNEINGEITWDREDSINA